MGRIIKKGNFFGVEYIVITYQARLSYLLFCGLHNSSLVKSIIFLFSSAYCLGLFKINCSIRKMKIVTNGS